MEANEGEGSEGFGTRFAGGIDGGEGGGGCGVVSGDGEGVGGSSGCFSRRGVSGGEGVELVGLFGLRSVRHRGGGFW